MQRLLGPDVKVDLSQPSHRPGPVFGDPRLTPYRLGQHSFQAVVLGAYNRRCAPALRLKPVDARPDLA